MPQPSHLPVLLGITLLTLACDPTPPPQPGPGGALGRFQCNRCHTAQDTLPAAPREKSCSGCHQAIQSGFYDTSEYKADHVARWKKNVTHFLEVPTLTNLHLRFQQEWLVSFLQNPHDLRPRLEAEMPRLPISEEDAHEIVRQLYPPTASPPPTPLTGDLQRGQTLLGQKGCMTCHAFTGAAQIPASPIPVQIPATQLASAMAQAPDLRHTRARMTPTTILAWLDNPTHLKPDALMPRIPLTAPERMDIATFLFTTPLQKPPTRDIPKRLPVLARKVAYAEVEARVFKRVCWHCHSDPVPVGGDGGPGNTGGLGFKGKGIDFSSRDALMRSDKTGALLSRDPNTPSTLIEHLLLRHREVAGHTDPNRRGMPLGLPPLSPEDIQLVESWVMQGATP